jgi:outer membrane protein OmpA-like peptidoglycan-associated protein/outer membrane protein W
MTKRLPSSLLLGCAALLLFATAAQAQVIRPNNTLYIEARAGLSIYGGDLDENPEDNIGTYFSDASWAAGGELGYQFTPSLAFGITGLYGDFPQLEGYGAVGGGTTNRLQIIGALRYFLFPSSAITPYVRLGVGYVFPADTPGALAWTDARSAGGFGPHLGLGVDLLLGRQFSLFLEAQGTAYFPDKAVDGTNPSEHFPGGVTPAGIDEVDYDVLGLVGGGFRFWFRPGAVRVDATIDCPTALEVGQAGTFTAFVNENATGPLTYTWRFGDGTTASGLVATKAYNQPGTYTVTFTAEGPINTDTETCLVTVTAPPVPALEIVSCTAQPVRTGPGQTITFTGQVRGGVTPLTYRWEFGDGATANTLTATHAYAQPGTYTATLTVTDAEGNTAVCTVTVTVEDLFCPQVTELNSVFFAPNMSSLSAEAQARLDENIAVLERCPEICVQIVGYADSRERNPLRLSEARADAVRAYYEQHGIAGNRLSAEGRGVAPDDMWKEDRGAGSRRADSIPTRVCPPPRGTVAPAN